MTFECDFPPEARTRRIVSTSALPEGLTPAEIDTAVAERMTAGEDLYRLDAGALADLDADLVVTQDLCAVCAVDVSVVDDALAYLGCRAEVLTLDPQDTRRGAGLRRDPRQGDRHRGGRHRSGAVAAPPARRRARRRRRSRAGAGDGPRVDRPALHPRPLGARHGQRRRRGRRSWGGAASGPGVRRGEEVADAGTGRGGRCALRLRAGRVGAAGARQSPTGCPPACRCGRSTPTRPSRDPGRGSSTASRRSPRSCTRTPALPLDESLARRIR